MPTFMNYQKPGVKNPKPKPKPNKKDKPRRR